MHDSSCRSWSRPLARSASATASPAVAIEQFARRHTRLRDQLAWRAARGDRLTPIEEAALRVFDAVLRRVEPPALALEPEVEDILRDVLPRLRPPRE